MTKLLYITNGINGSGGLERVLSIKASYLADKLNYEVHILVLNEGHVNPFYTFSSAIHFHTITAQGNALAYFVQYRRGIKKTIKRIKPTIIAVCDDGLKGVLFPVLFKTKAKVIYERHVSKNIEIQVANLSFFQKITTKIKFKLMDFAASKFDKFIILTNGSKREWNLNNLEVIPNPLPFEITKKAALANKKILLLGKQSFQKGYDRLLDIWQIVSSKRPDWQVEIYGKLDKSLALEKKIAVEKLKNIRFYPPTKNVEEKYKEASIYLMTSRFEGFGMVLIEAMSCGLPCISFDCPSGPADIITDGEDGFLIANGAIADFAKKIIYLIENEDKRKEMGTKAIQNIKKYELNTIMKQWDNLFNELIKKS